MTQENSEQKSLVKHFMSHPLFYVGAEMILEQAEKVFFDHRLSTASVLVDKKRILGVMTDFQFLKFFLLKNSDPNKARVKDFAEELDPVVLIDESEPITTAFKLMMQSPSHRIYVTAQGFLTGALSPKDILPFLAGDNAMERHRDDKDLVAARIKIKLLLTELSKAQATLEDYQQVFNSSPYMMHSVDLDGKITMANPMMHYVLGYRDHELIGKHITDLYSQQYHREAMAGLARVKITGFQPIVNTLMVRKDKELVKVDLASTAKTGPEGEVIGTVTISRISDSGKMLEALSSAAHALKITA
jgi:PAS domain S-box-containing protein